MDVVVAEVPRADETHGVRLVINCWLTTRRAADVGGLVLLADLAVAVGDDVPRAGVDTEEAGDLSQDAGLFQAFPDRALGSCFPDVLSATGKCPLARVAAPLQQDRACPVRDEATLGRP